MSDSLRIFVRPFTGRRASARVDLSSSSSPSVSVISDSKPEAFTASSVVKDDVDDAVLRELALFARVAKSNIRRRAASRFWDVSCRSGPRNSFSQSGSETLVQSNLCTVTTTNAQAPAFHRPLLWHEVWWVATLSL